MYKYQCSKQECGSVWTIQEGKLNGFVLTCPICSKGRGVFVSQIKNENVFGRSDHSEEMTISVDSKLGISSEDINERIESLAQVHSLTILEKVIEAVGKDIICKISYKLKS